MTRLLGMGILIRVSSDQNGCPSIFEWEDRAHPVLDVVDHWRVDVDWWRWRVWREYFQLTTTTDLLVVIYHDLMTDQWYLQRLYD